MTNAELAKKYVEMCKEGKFDACLDELFSKDAESVEAGAPPGKDPVSRGMAAIKEKGKWWADNHEVHKSEVYGPWPNGDRFAVRFVMDITAKFMGNKRFSMEEIGLFTIKDGKIVKEEFFYAMG